MSYSTCNYKHRIFEWKSTISDSVASIKHQPFQKANYFAVIFFEIENKWKFIREKNIGHLYRLCTIEYSVYYRIEAVFGVFIADQMWLSSAHIFKYHTSLLTGELSKSTFVCLVLPGPEMNILHLPTIAASAGLYSSTEHLPAIKCCIANHTLLWAFCQQYIHSTTLISH